MKASRRRREGLCPSPPIQHLPQSISSHSSRFSHPHLPVALRRLGRAGRGAGEPGPASTRAAASASGTPQRGPGRGGRLAPRPPPEAASGPARGSPPAAFYEGVEGRKNEEEKEQRKEGLGGWVSGMLQWE